MTHDRHVFLLSGSVYGATTNVRLLSNDSNPQQGFRKDGQTEEEKKPQIN